MTHQKFITYARAEHDYGFSKNALSIMKINKPELAHIFKGGRPAYVDINYFIRRFEFKKTMALKAQELVYLLEEHFSLTEIGKVIADKYGGHDVSIVRAMQKDIWNHAEFSTNITESKILYKIYRYWWSVERRLKRRGGSIEKILDKRMMEQ